MSVAVPKPAGSPLDRSVTTLYGVGPERTAQLARIEIHTIEDLLLHRPHRYEDRKRMRTIAELALEEPAITRGKVMAAGVKWFRKHTKSIFELVLDDGTARLHCRWWNLPYMEKYFAIGDEVLVFGKLLGLKPRTIDHPETEVIEGGEESLIHMNRITPVYPLTEGLPQRYLRSLIWRTLNSFESQIQEPWSVNVGQTAKKPTMGSVQYEAASLLPSRARAIHMLHCPEHAHEPELARKRLALDEFVELQRKIQIRRRNFATKAEALPCGGDNRLIKPFLARLGFKLTEAQTQVLRELRKDMNGAHPMRRLLQGDVGSGKTVVAACCSLMTLESGHNVVLMAPTEILAEQHWMNFSKWFAPLQIQVELQTGSRKTRSGAGSKNFSGATAREAGASAGDANGIGADRKPPRLFIGTHALIEPGFVPENIGLVVIDEQHKFGVAQREQLLHKGHYPHLLVMTATPIPRTLGLTIYGELDISTINHAPRGRGRIKTFIRDSAHLPKVWDFIRSKIAEGRQAFVVYPRVEETSDNGVKAVTKEFNSIQESLASVPVGLLHGRLQTEEKERVMAAFRDNQVKVLLATSIVEVGLDVPNATVMLVENAEQFGLAQLHQLRGRIGRGAHDSFCILVAGSKNAEARRRLQVLEGTEDGFKIAEADLKIRGPGELLGHQQSGMPRFRFADFSADLDLIHQARGMAQELVAAKP
jgi:ATP-dependent DNA helicase RecG